MVLMGYFIDFCYLLPVLRGEHAGSPLPVFMIILFNFYGIASRHGLGLVLVVTTLQPALAFAPVPKVTVLPPVQLILL
jgi:hypothetical protein